MTAIKDIVQIINDHFKKTVFECSDNFAGARFWLIADTVKREGLAGAFPGIFNDDGSVYYPGVDEDFPMIIYHRAMNIQFQDSARQSYGDVNFQNMTASMRMTIFSDRRRIPLTADELALFIYSNFPSHLKNLPNFGTVVIRIASVIPNNSAAFANEYPGAVFFLKPEHVLININYTIESMIRKDCFNECPF